MKWQLSKSIKSSHIQSNVDGNQTLFWLVCYEEIHQSQPQIF